MPFALVALDEQLHVDAVAGAQQAGRALFRVDRDRLQPDSPSESSVIGSAIWPGREQLAVQDRLAFDDRRRAAGGLRALPACEIAPGGTLSLGHSCSDSIAASIGSPEVDVVQRDVDRHRLELPPADWQLRSMTWLMPIEATRPQPNASANSKSDFGRMISPSYPLERLADTNASASLTSSLAWSQTEPCRFLRHDQHIRFRQFAANDRVKCLGAS